MGRGKCSTVYSINKAVFFKCGKKKKCKLFCIELTLFHMDQEAKAIMENLNFRTAGWWPGNPSTTLSMLASMFHLTDVCVVLAPGALEGLLLLLRSEATASVFTSSSCSFCVEIAAGNILSWNC